MQHAGVNICEQKGLINPWRWLLLLFVAVALGDASAVVEAPYTQVLSSTYTPTGSNTEASPTATCEPKVAAAKMVARGTVQLLQHRSVRVFDTHTQIM